MCTLGLLAKVFSFADFNAETLTTICVSRFMSQEVLAGPASPGNAL